MRRWLGYFYMWLVLLACAVINGGFRDLVTARFLDPLAANQVSVLTLILLHGVVIWRMLRRRPPASRGEAWVLGVFWLALTVLFETQMTVGLAGQDWATLKAQYDLASGHLWPLVPAWLLVAPPLLAPRPA